MQITLPPELERQVEDRVNSGQFPSAEALIGAAVSEFISSSFVPPDNYASLTELLDGITPENRHSEVDWGSPVGKEEW